MVQRMAARFVKGRYGMYESVTQMLEELTWVPLSKRRENACLILFYKIINNVNVAMVPHSCLEKADGRTRKKHNLKIRHIGYNVDPYGQSFFPNCISAWQGRQTGGGWGVSTPPEFWMGGLNTCQPPLILRKFFLGGVGSP